MPYEIDDTTESPDADVGGERNPNNPDTYEETDDNYETPIVQN